MGLLLSPTQKAHLAKGQQLFFSPEAIAMRENNPEMLEIAQLGALDHFMQGWKHLEPRIGAKGKELPGFALGNDDAVDIDDLERVQHQIAETKRFMQDGEVPEAFVSLTPSQLDFLRECIERHLSGGAIDKIGELGTKNRTYSLKDPIVERRGQPIPAVFAEGQKRERGTNLLLNKLQNIDVDTGVGNYGMSVDALHREAAANAPEKVTDPGNIRMGNSSLNQSVKEFEGSELQNALKTRLLRLNDEEFALEHGVRAAPPDKEYGLQTKRDNRLHTDREKEFEQLLAGIRNADTLLG